MNELRVLKISSINTFFMEDIKCVERGENSLGSNHLNK